MIYLLLHNIRSAHNVGSMFRTADAAGIEKIFISGYTPAPIDRFGRPVQEIVKTALGGEINIPWEKVDDPKKFITEFRKKLKKEYKYDHENLQIIAIEQDKRAVDYKKVVVSSPTLFIVGNEVDGISQELLDEADIIAEIPMKGKKESLNVGVSLGIALFRMLNI